MAKQQAAVTRIPLPGGGEFVAWWPGGATLADLRVASMWVEAVLGGWIADAEKRADAADDGEVEYRSWQLTHNAAGNRLARQGQSELTGLLGPGSEAR